LMVVVATREIPSPAITSRVALMGACVNP
jgi:hypothetical protein